MILRNILRTEKHYVKEMNVKYLRSYNLQICEIDHVIIYTWSAFTSICHQVVQKLEEIMQLEIYTYY